MQPILDSDDLLAYLQTIRSEQDTIRQGILVLQKKHDEVVKLVSLFNEYVEQIKPLLNDVKRDRVRRIEIYRALLKKLVVLESKINTLQTKEWENDLFAD